MRVWTLSSQNVFERVVGMAVAVAIVIGAAVASAATTVPVLWTAGGLDAGNGGAGQAGRMTSDASGNVAVVSGPAGGRDLAVTSYTADGILRWRNTVTPAVGTFVGDWVVAAPNGDFVAIGHNQDSHGRPIQGTMVRYASNGTLLWRIDFTSGFYPTTARLVIDAAGNEYLAWSAVGTGFLVQKYSPSGALIWSQQDSTTGGGYAIASSLTLSPDGADVAMSGSISGGATWITAIYNSTTGVRRWLVTAGEGIAARDVVVDATRVYVTGQGNVETSGFLTVIAYDRATGARVWRTDAAPSGSQSVGLRIALAPDGNLVATGYASGGYLDWWTVALSSSGTVLWQARRGLAATGDEVPAAVFVLSDGTTVVSGTGGPTVRDVLGNSYMQGVTVGYSQTGVLLWEGFSKMGTVWATTLPNNDVCAAGGYDALVTCWRAGAPPSPPDAPTGLAAQLSTGAIQLAWLDNADNETAYSVERCHLTGSGWTSLAVIATLPANAVSYRDTTYPSGTTINYRVRASNAGVNSEYSNTASITVLSSGDPPTAIMSATPSTGTAPLSVAFDGSRSNVAFGTIRSWAWLFGDGTAGSGATTTHVYSTPGAYTATLTVTASSGVSNSTATVIVVSAPVLPAAPSALSATVLSRSSIRLNWTNATTNQTQVRIERCLGSRCTAFVQVAAVGGTATTFTDTRLASRTAYTYRVRASSTAGVSAYSNLASASTR